MRLCFAPPLHETVESRDSPKMSRPERLKRLAETRSISKLGTATRLCRRAGAAGDEEGEGGEKRFCDVRRELPPLRWVSRCCCRRPYSSTQNLFPSPPALFPFPLLIISHYHPSQCRSPTMIRSASTPSVSWLYVAPLLPLPIGSLDVDDFAGHDRRSSRSIKVPYIPKSSLCSAQSCLRRLAEPSGGSDVEGRRQDTA